MKLFHRTEIYISELVFKILSHWNSWAWFICLFSYDKLWPQVTQSKYSYIHMVKIGVKCIPKNLSRLEMKCGIRQSGFQLIKCFDTSNSELLLFWYFLPLLFLALCTCFLYLESCAQFAFCFCFLKNTEHVQLYLSIHEHLKLDALH